MSTIHATPYNAHASLGVNPTAVSPVYVNPAQMQNSNAKAGPSSSSTFSSSTAPKKKSPPAPVKRKRSDPSDESGDGAPTSQVRKNREGPKKKKANRACFHCQKAHLTCDDSRPCQRCVKRGIAPTCTEGHRKKAKYLLDEEELEQLKRSKSSAPEGSQEPPAVTSAESYTPQTNNDSLFNVSFDPSFSFGSEAANMEYSILSAILGNPSPPQTTRTPPPPPPPSQFPPWSTESISLHHNYGQSPPSRTYGSASYNVDSQVSTSPNTSNFMAYPYQIQRSSSDTQDQLQYPQFLPPQSPRQQPQTDLHPLAPRHPEARSPLNNSGVFIRAASPRGLFSPPPSNHSNSPTSSSSMPPGCTELALTRPSSCQSSQLQSIHDRVLTPYDYTQGYHFLMKHLPSRFEKNDILRVVRALAIFRPSLIALQMPLSLDDEVFAEKCFQRTLLELDKLISFSGTPTVVWRRTGEICLVAPEFCMLTDWSSEELIGGKKYIYELFENQSVVEYWENFASHAFENTTQSVYSHCVLLKPSGAPVPSTFCFSIRRDLFDLPSIVIGQWLPLL